MSASSLQAMARVNTRSIKKLEKPRPLKLSTSQSRHTNADNRLSSGGIGVEEVMALADSVCQHITNGNLDRSLQSNVLTLSSSLKLYGQQLETVYKDQLDRLFVTFRNGSRDERLDYVSRLHLLELVELRGANWAGCDNMSDYYRHKVAHSHSHEMEVLDSPVTPTGSLLGSQFSQLGSLGVLGLTPSPSPTTPQPAMLGPGEVLKTSGKFPKPTKIPNKNYCKDEVVIRNSDSGKVMGIKGRRVHMIEEMSETIISFQRVNPGAKERLVQITGPSEEKIVHARQLMEDTIRRNASPVRPEQPESVREQREALGGSSSSLNSSASDDSVRLSHGGVRRSTLLHSFSTSDASLGEYKYTVAVGGCVLKITGSNHEFVRAAKLVLDEYFASQDLSYFNSYEEELPSPPAAATSASTPPSGANTGAPGSPQVTVTNMASPPPAIPPSPAPTAPGIAPPPAVDSATAMVASATVPVSVPLSDLTHSLPVVLESTAQAVLSANPVTPTATASSSLDSSTSESDETIRAAAPSATTGEASEKRRQYTLDKILSLATCPASQEAPVDWQRISKEFPSIVKKVVEPFDPSQYVPLPEGTYNTVISATDSVSLDAE